MLNALDRARPQLKGLQFLASHEIGKCRCIESYRILLMIHPYDCSALGPLRNNGLPFARSRPSGTYVQRNRSELLSNTRVK